MKKIDTGQAISILANLGVIAGIVFLAMELAQNNELMESEARFNRVGLVSAGWENFVEHPHLTELLIKDRNGAALTDAEALTLAGHWMGTLYRAQWQYQEEILDWVPPLNRAFAAYPSFRSVWAGSDTGSRSAGNDNFTEPFIEFFQENVIPQ